MQDSEIIEALKTGRNQDVLNSFYETVLPNVTRYILSNSGNEDDAKDIFQDAVVVFYKQVKLNKLELHRSIAGYVFMVSKNLWINKAKRDKKIQITEDVPERNEVDKGILSLMISEEREKMVKNVMNKLGEKCAQMLQYVFYQGYTLSEVTKLMKFSSPKVAHTTHYRCKKKMIDLIGDNEEFIQTLRTHE